MSQTETITTNKIDFEKDENAANVWRQQILKTYRVYVVTYNVGSRFPDNISLRNLLGLDVSVNHAKEETHLLPDIYALGLQEVNSQPQQQVLGIFKDDPWTSKAKKLLKQYDYVCIKNEQMQGLLISIFVKREHVEHLQEIEAEFTRTGFGGIWGNKGAVSVRFNLYGCGLVFVVSHLAAHDNHLDERIEDYKQIIENHHYHVPRFREIYDHDYVFWFGDLNFRLKGEDPAAEIRDKILKNEKLSDLLERDQLLYVREEKHKAFQFLHERLPNFPPTFKFKEGTSEYDLKRRPAWTDRIMYAVQPFNRQPNMPLAIEQCSYKSHPGYTISDHKPVSSDFTIKLYPNYRNLSVTFQEISVWPIGKDFIVEYTKPNQFEERDNDWIGIFRDNYDSFSDYFNFQYVNRAESSSSDESSMDDEYEGSSRHKRDHHHKRQKLQRQKQDGYETVRIEFPDTIDLKSSEKYLLIYFQNTGLRGVTSVAGISNTFGARRID